MEFSFGESTSVFDRYSGESTSPDFDVMYGQKVLKSGEEPSNKGKICVRNFKPKLQPVS